MTVLSKTKCYVVEHLILLCRITLNMLYSFQAANASDEDEETTALMIKAGSGTSAKEEKENEAFFRKVDIWSRLDHPSIPTVFSAAFTFYA